MQQNNNSEKTTVIYLIDNVKFTGFQLTNFKLIKIENKSGYNAKHVIRSRVFFQFVL